MHDGILTTEQRVLGMVGGAEGKSWPPIESLVNYLTRRIDRSSFVSGGGEVACFFSEVQVRFNIVKIHNADLMKARLILH